MRSLSAIGALLFVPAVAAAQSIQPVPDAGMTVIANVPGVPLDPGTNPGDAINLIVSAVHDRNWAMVAIVGVLLIVWVVRKFLAPMIHGKVGEALNSDRGGAWLALLCAILSVIGGGLVAGVPFGLQLVLDGIIVGFGSMGGWSFMMKNLPDSARSALKAAPKPVEAAPKQQ